MNSGLSREAGFSVPFFEVTEFPKNHRRFIIIRKNSTLSKKANKIKHYNFLLLPLFPIRKSYN